MIKLILASLGGIGGILAGGLLGILPQLATAAMAVLRGALAIITDLAQSEFGRHILGAMVAGILILYVYHSAHQKGLTEGRQEVHNCEKKIPQSHEPASIFDPFNRN